MYLITTNNTDIETIRALEQTNTDVPVNCVDNKLDIDSIKNCEVSDESIAELLFTEEVSSK